MDDQTLITAVEDLDLKVQREEVTLEEAAEELSAVSLRRLDSYVALRVLAAHGTRRQLAAVLREQDAAVAALLQELPVSPDPGRVRTLLNLATAENLRVLASIVRRQRG